MFIRRKAQCYKNEYCRRNEDLRMKYIDAGGRESCAGDRCRKKRNKCDVCIKCCD